MLNLKKFASDNRIIINAFLVTLVAAITAFIFQEESWGWGFLYGNLISSLNFVFITIAVNRYIKMDSDSAKLAARGNYLVRMLFIASAIIVLKFIPAINVWATMLGFIPLRLAVYLEGIISLVQEKRGEKHGS